MDNQIKTSDMYLAAALLAYGSQIVEVDRTDTQRQVFHFDHLPVDVSVHDSDQIFVPTVVKELSEFSLLFLTRRLWFPPTYVDCIRQMKSCIYGK